MRTKNNISGQLDFYLSGMPDVDSARPYDFLCEMDEVEGKLLGINRHMEAQIDYGNVVLDNIHKLNEPFAEDLIPQLEEEQESLRVYHAGLTSWRDDLSTTPEMFLPHDNLPDVLNSAINITKELFDQQEILRWTIMEHNADLSKTSKGNSLSTDEEIDSFFASL
ncbi:TPA: hypothetical protein RU587_002624 [Salmonella enterica]|nr:hypothetical protein [Salmonella enterica subsp. enterica serovar Veneziana]ECJ2441190.1 hypothetical protein [Salmonella enterica subsp. diarizonae]HEA0294287.1 hypothetical protein [Salmonella enterica]ECQ1024665.1 hypothetical protein [Salmonella enterica subsp. diarizonae]EDE1923137.1 hypothetical protein [Salmonella enterica subsp. diarizonae]